MKKFLSLLLLSAIIFNVFTPNIYALSSNEYLPVGNSGLSYKAVSLDEDTKLYEIKDIGGEFLSQIYESH